MEHTLLPKEAQRALRLAAKSRNIENILAAEISVKAIWPKFFYTAEESSRREMEYDQALAERKVSGDI